MARYCKRTVNLRMSFAVLVAGLHASQALAGDDVCDTSPVGGPQVSIMCSLGTLSGGTYSIANGVSADGSVVVGESHIPDGFRAFRWTDAGMVSIGTLSSGSDSMANGVSADGSVVVGWSNNRAFRWTDEGMVSLGVLSGGTSSHAFSVSADGSVVVGESHIAVGKRAFRWTDEGMVSLGVLSGGNVSRARGVNADGSVVVGESNSSDGYRAFRWTNEGMVSLGVLSGGTSSHARGVSADGTVVIGYSDSADGERGFRWTDSGMVSLGTLSGGSNSRAYGLNADGSVVVGGSDSADGERAFRWTDSGMVSLGTLSGGSNSRAYGVSADGSVVVGQSGSKDGMRAFIWRGVMEDLENLVASFRVLGNDSAVAVAEQEGALSQMMGQSGIAAAGQNIISVRAGTQLTGRNPTTVDARTTSFAAISLGRGINKSLTIGATISTGGASFNSNTFNMDTGFAAAIWGQYSEGGALRTGLQFGGVLGYMRNEGDMVRGRLLNDVVLAIGHTRLDTRAAQASFGYGFERGNWLVIPSLGVVHYDTTRPAYAESGAVFNASYDEMRTSRTVATLGVASEVTVGAQGRLSFGVGVDHEVNPERPRMLGTSDIPGLGTFDIASHFTANRTRAFAVASYAHQLGNGGTVSGDLRVDEAVYGTTPSIGLGLSYQMRF